MGVGRGRQKGLKEKYKAKQNTMALLFKINWDITAYLMLNQ